MFEGYTVITILYDPFLQKLTGIQVEHKIFRRTLSLDRLVKKICRTYPTINKLYLAGKIEILINGSDASRHVIVKNDDIVHLFKKT